MEIIEQATKQTKPFIQLLILLALSFAFSIVAVGIALPFSQQIHLTQSLAQLIMFGGCAIFFAFLFQKSPFHYLKINHLPATHRTEWWTWGFLLLFIAAPAVDFVSQWNHELQFPASLYPLERLLRRTEEMAEAMLNNMLSESSLPYFLLNILVIALIPAICEELFFRGAFQRIMQQWTKNKHVAVWITAIVFSLFHMQIFGFFPRILLGILLGYLFVYSGSLWISILAHFLNNASVVILYQLYQTSILPINPENLSLCTSPFVLYTSIVATILILIRCSFLHKPNTSEI